MRMYVVNGFCQRRLASYRLARRPSNARAALALLNTIKRVLALWGAQQLQMEA